MLSAIVTYSLSAFCVNNGAAKKNGNSHGMLLPLYGVVRRAVGGRLHLLQHVACGSADETTPFFYQ